MQTEKRKRGGTANIFGSTEKKSQESREIMPSHMKADAREPKQPRTEGNWPGDARFSTENFLPAGKKAEGNYVRHFPHVPPDRPAREQLILHEALDAYRYTSL